MLPILYHVKIYRYLKKQNYSTAARSKNYWPLTSKISTKHGSSIHEYRTWIEPWRSVSYWTVAPKVVIAKRAFLMFLVISLPEAKCTLVFLQKEKELYKLFFLSNKFAPANGEKCSGFLYRSTIGNAGTCACLILTLEDKYEVGSKQDPYHYR